MTGLRMNNAAAPATRYSAMQIGLHWLVVVLVLSQWLTSGSIERTHNPLVPPASTDLLLHAMHNYGGMTIGALMGLRLLMRIFRPVPPAGSLPPWQNAAAMIVHWGLYASLLAQAATGFVASYLWSAVAPVHALLWNVTLALVLTHVAAAAFHAAKRDGVVDRMTPFS